MEIWGGYVHFFKVSMEKKRALRTISGLLPITKRIHVYVNSDYGFMLV